jgi:aspartate racemase
MKTIGILGGMSWESTADYYRLINKYINNCMGKLHSAKIILYSFDFDEIEQLQHQNRWEELAELLCARALDLQKCGADFILIATNTMHKVAGEIEKRLSVPVIHIADVTAEEIVKDCIGKVALFGTKFTMSEDFYKGRIKEKYNIEVAIPNEKEMDEIHRIIYSELCMGIVKDESRKKMVAIAERMKEEEGIEGLILGCTELPMIISQRDLSIKVYNTTEIHSKHAAEKSIGK